LAEAIAYEAGNEPEAGQQAVAQVVLNRVRHPAFPKSVCDVVFQGSERATGCQFTFTCDGSLRRTLSRRTWQEALRVAAAAMAGETVPAIGDSTHYHANYVSPRWAPQLVRTASIGAHIFYRFPARGEASAFRGTAVPAAKTASGASRRNSPALFLAWGLTVGDGQTTPRPGVGGE
jgi:spore germination cell wall hydrolase CwlJ-like protein